MESSNSVGGGNAKFGLTIRSRKEAPAVAETKSKTAAAIFNDADSDEEEAAQEDQSAAAKFQRKYGQLEKSKDKRLVEQVMAEDPSIYDYDGQYEQMQRIKDQKVAEQKEADKEKKPKYAHKLLEAHKKRELEKLLHDEHTYKKERVEEAGQFEDKEVFITGAYRQQIEERNQFRVELEQQDRMDEMRSVQNQSMWQQAFQRKMLDDRARDYPGGEELPKTESGEQMKVEAPEEKVEEEGEKKPSAEELANATVKKEEEGRSADETEEPRRKRRKEAEEREERRSGRGREEGRGGERGRRRSSSGGKVEEEEKERSRRHHHHHREEEEEQRRGHGRGEEKDKHSTEHRRRERVESTGSSKEKVQEAGAIKEEKQRPKVGGTAAATFLPVMDDLTEEVRRMEIIRQILRRRNDKEAVEAARQRYLERRERGECVPPPPH